MIVTSLIPIDEVVHFDVCTHDPATGDVTDADATPTFDVYEEATDTGLLGATNFTKRTSLTGNYRGSFTASAANGFEAGKWYSVIASATVGSVAAKKNCGSFRVAPAESAAGVPKGDASHFAGTAYATAAAALDDATLAAIAALNNLSAAQVNAEVDTALTDIHLDHLLAASYDPASKPGAADALLNELVESDGGVARYTANALEQAPTGGSAPTVEEIADEVETRTIAAVTTVNGLAANTVTAAALATDAVTEIQSGIATASELAKVPKSDSNVTWNATAAAQLQSEATDALNAYDPPTHAELTSALAAADDAVLAAIAALNNLSSAQVTAAVPTATQNADALLKRDFSAVTGEATRSALNALRFLRNKWSIAGGTLTITKEDDAAEAWTASVTQTAGDPVSAVDPA